MRSLMNFNFRRCDCFVSNEPSVCALCIRNVLDMKCIRSTGEVNVPLKICHNFKVDFLSDRRIYFVVGK